MDVFRIVRTFLELSANERLATLQFVWWCAVEAMVVKRMTPERLRRMMQEIPGREPVAPISLDRLATIIRSAERRMPGTCLSRAIAAHRVLAYWGHKGRIRIGVTVPGDFSAHAWSECDGVEVTRNSADQRSVEIISF